MEKKRKEKRDGRKRKRKSRKFGILFKSLEKTVKGKEIEVLRKEGKDKRHEWERKKRKREEWEGG